MNDSQSTTDHRTIRQWAESKLEPISWEEFFDKFEESELAFLYQDTIQRRRC